MIFENKFFVIEIEKNFNNLNNVYWFFVLIFWIFNFYCFFLFLEKGLIFDSFVVFLGFFILGLGFVGVGVFILFLIIVILCYMVLNR